MERLRESSDVYRHSWGQNFKYIAVLFYIISNYNAYADTVYNVEDIAEATGVDVKDIGIIIRVLIRDKFIKEVSIDGDSMLIPTMIDIARSN